MAVGGGSVGGVGVDGLTVDGFPERGAFVVGEGVEEGFSKRGFGVEGLVGRGGGGGGASMAVMVGAVVTPGVVAMMVGAVEGRWGVRAAF